MQSQLVDREQTTVKCELCNEEYYVIQASHLKYVHGITPDDYRIMFPAAKLWSDGSRYQLSESCSEAMTEGVRRQIAESLTGYEQDEETRRKRSVSLTAYYATHEVSTEERTERTLRSALKKQKYMRRYQPRYYLDSEHRNERAKSMRRWNEEHREEVTEYNRRWNEMHPGKRTEYGRKRRALEAGSDGNFTPEEFKLLCEVFEHRCIYCGQELQLVPDHAIPISRGGSNNIENIVPACVLCNQKKHTMTYDEFVGR